jgi:hypothetical protein
MAAALLLHRPADRAVEGATVAVSFSALPMPSDSEGLLSDTPVTATVAVMMKSFHTLAAL